MQTLATITCPPGFKGNVSRTCTADGWAPITGRCARKHCPATSFRLEGWKTDQSQEERALHTAFARSVPEGAGEKSLPCPLLNYTGEMIVSCGADAELWTVQTRCALAVPQQS